jgi:hypothetical protein
MVEGVPGGKANMWRWLQGLFGFEPGKDLHPFSASGAFLGILLAAPLIYLRVFLCETSSGIQPALQGTNVRIKNDIAASPHQHHLPLVLAEKCALTHASS